MIHFLKVESDIMGVVGIVYHAHLVLNLNNLFMGLYVSDYGAHAELR